MKVFAIFLLLLISIGASNIQAFDDNDSHPRLTEKAIENSVLNDYISKNLGLSNGVETELQSSEGTYSILEWLKKGSKDEDSPNCRASNHFHNPLLPWDQSYMTDEPWYISTWCGLTGYSTKYSNVTWATGYLSPAPDGSKIAISNQQMGWDNARNYYLQALTASNSTDRETYFAKTFQALGQVLHLLEDMAVPAHVRNDFRSHLAFQGVQLSWPNRWFGNSFEYYVKNNPGLVSGASDIPSFTKVTDYWDTDGSAIGLAEFTNANYFSDSTIPNNSPTVEHTFPNPQVSNTSHQICEDYDPGATVMRKYISRGSGSSCPQAGSGTIDHFATPSLLNEESIITNDNISTLKLWLDDNVHDTYAKELLPKAVGYSAGLLNYFFRGQMNMKEDSVNLGQYIIENKSAETMSGTFSLYYDDAYNNRYPVSGASWNLSINANSQSSSLSFTKPTSPVPVRYILVFNGKLGNEEGAVAGFVYNPKLAFLVIKQTSIESDVVEWGCTGCENEWGSFTDSAYKGSGVGYWNSYVLKFDLEWLGEVNTITNVALIRIYNYGSCEYETTVELYNPNRHSISLIRPTDGNLRGYIEVYLTAGNSAIEWSFPNFIRVDTIDSEGNPQSFYEPIFVVSNTLYSTSLWDEGQYNSSYSTRRGLSDASYIPYTGMCVSDKVNASYSFDLSGLSYDRDYIHSDYKRYYIYSVGETYEKSYQQEPLLPFFPYTVEQLKIKRTWKQSTLNFLESVGYDITELPTWDIYIDYWRTDYQPYQP